MIKIRELPKSSSRILYSEQIITSVYSVVKELLENALDSQAKNVEIKLEEYGTARIVVKDNGSGISKDDIPFAAKPHFTSKITSHSDLTKLQSYGFRGEALGAICAVADLEMTTKSAEDDFGSAYCFDSEGNVSSSKVSPCSQGTTVTVQNLFKNFPVRKQFYRSLKNKKDELKKVEDLLIAFGCIQYGVRFALYHNRNLVWQKPAVNSIKESITCVFGQIVMDNFEYLTCEDHEKEVNIQLYMPKLNSSTICCNCSPNRCIVAINNRPVRIKDIDKVLKEYYSKNLDCNSKAKYPMCCVFLEMRLGDIDINIEPNKTSVMLHNPDSVFELLSTVLKNYYTVQSSDITAKSSACVMKSPHVQCNNEQKTNVAESKLTHECIVDKPEAAVSLPVNLKENCSKSASVSNKMNEKVHVKPKDIQTPCAVNEPNSSFRPNKTNQIVNSLAVTSEQRDMQAKNIPNIKDLALLSSKKQKKISLSNDVYHHVKALNEYFTSDNTGSENQEPKHLEAQLLSGIEAVAQRDSLSKDISVAVLCNNASTEGNVSIRKRHSSDPSPSSKKSKNLDNKASSCTKQQAWSRGHWPNDLNVQPVTVLKPMLLNNSDNINHPKSLEHKELPENIDQVLTERKLTPFDFFCRKYRLEIAAQNPGFNSHQIAQILKEKWSSLSYEEKAIFKNMIAKDYPKKIKTKNKLSNAVSQMFKKKLTEVASASSKKICMKKKRTKIIEFNVKDMSCSSHESFQKSSDKGLTAINCISSGVWICHQNEKLLLLNSSRLQETVIYYRLLETFHLHIMPIEPIYLSDFEIDEDLMKILNVNSVKPNCETRIEDRRLIANGFDVICLKRQNEVVFKIVGMTNKISFYGVDDLKEILLLLRNKGCSAKVSECRPGKVILYLQGDAIRIARKSLAIQRCDELEDLLKQKKYIPSNTNACIHHKPFLHELWVMSPTENATY